MSLEVKTGGVWKAAQEVYVKTGGVWKACVDVLVKTGGVWKSALYAAGSHLVVSGGTTSFTVPSGVYSLTYNTWGGGGGSGKATQSSGALAVTPGEVLTLVCASNVSGSTTTEIKRSTTSLCSASGTVSSYPSPVLGVESTLSTNFFYFNGNVDSHLHIGVDTMGSGSYSGSGSSGDLSSGASSAGCYYSEFSEGNHGDLGATVSINEVSSYDSSKYQEVYLVSSSFRSEAGVNITQHPLASNSFRSNFDTWDGGYSEGTATMTFGVRQGYGTINGNGYISLSW